MNRKITVELIGYYGSDKTHAQSAWTSTDREITDEKLTRIPDLLKYLAEHKHETPFEKSLFHFNIEVEQASHIHTLKHRIGVSVNGESARYKELTDKFYIPEDWEDIKIVDISDAPYLDMSKFSAETWGDMLRIYTELGNFLYHRSATELTQILKRKRAKESARFFRTMNSMLTLDTSFNWRSFYHFYSLRGAETAQLEIRIVADKMLECIRKIPGNPFKYTLMAHGLDK